MKNPAVLNKANVAENLQFRFSCVVKKVLITIKIRYIKSEIRIPHNLLTDVIEGGWITNFT